MKDKNLPENSTNLIESFVSEKNTCLLRCNQNILCNIVVYNSNKRCTLGQVGAINELIDTSEGQTTKVYINQK